MKDIDDVSSKDARKGSSTGVFSHSFSGNLRPRREKLRFQIAAGGMHVLWKTHYRWRNCCRWWHACTMEDTLSVEELQSAVQGAVAHCKNSMMQNKTVRDQ
ncbi:hypothetical protein POTOM_030165 [Populus tomentosa]|uniref:Uncharacterized protein n=1 Tax=Populus tomentosa TaxID=118781 RepID=A0A8X8CUN8_POPTO|nr:hypothetical protein POTOM_030165 [Populus tomentosa]